MNKRGKLKSFLIAMLILTIGAAMLAGCGNRGDTDNSANETSAAEEVQNTGSDDSGDWKDVEEEPEIDIASLGGPGGVDVDLTKLSSTMVYAVVNDMLIKPDSYIGKTVRMSGSMSVYHD